MDRQLQARIAPITSRLWMLAAQAAQPPARKPKAAAKPQRAAALRAAA
jgi:hypothetical protein